MAKLRKVAISCTVEDNKINLRREYLRILADLGLLPLIITPEMKPYLKEISEEVSALVIPGGADLDPRYYGEENRACNKLVSYERVELEFEMLKIFIPTQKPILGICYGMQLLNVFFGGSLHQDIETSVAHRDGRHLVKITKSFPLEEGTYEVNSSHHQAVKKLGEGLEVFSLAEDGIIEGFFHREHPFLVGVQWHPERDSAEASKLLWRIFAKNIK